MSLLPSLPFPSLPFPSSPYHMAEFVESLNSPRPSRPCAIELIDHNLGLVSQFEQLNGSAMETFNLGLLGFSNDNILPFLESLANTSPIGCPKPNIEPSAPDGEVQGRGGRKRTMEALPETNSMSSSATTTDQAKKKNRSGSGKRLGRSSSKNQVEEPKEVVHVRARRGQATDSHSLAERVRREKINERMRYLQELVPGCYKAMGMAGALDEIINYVQSLQNQVEFLSMKLSTASSYYDFNLDMEAITTQQVLPRDGDAYLQAEALEKVVREQGNGDQCTSFQSAMQF